MEQTRFASRLRYLDAGDLDDSAVEFDRLDVRGSDGTHLGQVDGFLVDSSSGRVLYTVVDSGGWFTSRRLLLPIGHATVDADPRAMRVDVSREALRSFPDFNERSFREFSDDDLRSYERRMITVCCPDDTSSETSAAALNATARHFQQPPWWTALTYNAERLRPIEPRPFKGRRPSPAPSPEVRSQQDHDRESITASGGRGRDDESPHFEGRAQPGDVLGLETGGERTVVGDTAEDEDERRRAAERAAAADDSESKR